MPLLSNREMFQRVRNATIPINDGDAKGSAFLVKRDGKSVVCTAHHVLCATPSLYDLGVKTNGSFDFAMLTEADNLGYDTAQIDYGSPEDVEPGDTVYYGGYPFSAQTPHVYTGTISAIEKDVLGRRSLKIDGTAVKGMSGGPIFIQKYDEVSDSYVPTIIGFLASETFDPVEKFEDALRGLALQVVDLKVRETHNHEIREEMASWGRNQVKIERGQLFGIEELDAALKADSSKNHHEALWDILREKDILTSEGRLNSEKLGTVQSVLGDEYKQYELLIMQSLLALKEASEKTSDHIALSRFAGAIPEAPTDHLVRVGMSLVNSLSTGVVTGYFIVDALQNLHDFDKTAGLPVKLCDEFEIGDEYDRLFQKKRKASNSVELSDEEVHVSVIDEVTTMAGRYGNMLLYVKRGKVESDHFPPKSVYKKAKDPKISGLQQKEMASLNLRYKDHRDFITTGSKKEAVEFRGRLEKLFAEGRYADAIDINIGEYDKAGLITEANKAALVTGLDVHLGNGLITDDEKADLVKKYSLAPPVMPLSPRRSGSPSARQLAESLTGNWSEGGAAVGATVAPTSDDLGKRPGPPH